MSLTLVLRHKNDTLVIRGGLNANGLLVDQTIKTERVPVFQVKRLLQYITNNCLIKTHIYVCIGDADTRTQFSQ